jgi:hypothetical protein
MRTDDQGLVVVVADDADAFAAVQFGKVGFEFGSKIITLDAVNGSFELDVVFDGHTAALGAQM